MSFRLLAAAVALCFGLTLAPFARAQGMMPGMGGPGMGPGMGGPSGGGGGGAAKKPKKKDPNEPETHAATGAVDNVVAPGGEPSLPD